MSASSRRDWVDWAVDAILFGIMILPLMFLLFMVGLTLFIGGGIP